jgi:hypothetical protein
MNEIEKKFWERGISQGLWVVFSREVAIEFVEACRKESIEIFGIDGFLLHPNNGIQPFMEYSIDFSSTSYPKKIDFNCWDEAIMFLQRQSNEFHFEIVCDD